MPLFSHESIQHVHGFEFLTYFQEGDSSKPLVVFFPGWAHLARIAYGGTDFFPFEESLAHAFLKHGNSFLAISYPLDNAVYSTIYPQMKIKDWAEGAAAIAQEILNRSHNPSLVAIHWSGGGHLLTRFKEACDALRIAHSFSISLEATPPNIITQHDRLQDTEILANGLASIAKRYPTWAHELQTMLGKEVDVQRYKENFLGAIPISLLGTSLVYREGSIQEDLASSMEDRQSLQFARFPLVVSIAGNSQQASYHPIVDLATWSHTNIRKIYHGYLAPLSAEISQLSNDRWYQLQDLIATFADQMIHFIGGNHFLFIGQIRTQQIVRIMEEAEKNIFAFRKTLADLLRIDPARLNGNRS